MTRKTASERYTKLSPIEHVLLRPDTYVGSIQTENREMYVATDYEDIKNIKIEYKSVDYNPAFIKIFDEVIVNASDHSIRTGEVTYIKVNITDEFISIENDGPGIPVVIHDEHKIYIPELIFANLLSGENFADNEERFVGGRNGIGIKCTNIFSKKFIIETADGNKTYYQECLNNLSRINKPKIRKSKKSFVKVTYYPDYEKFGLNGITEDLKSILTRRVLDIAAYNPNVKVFLNGKKTPINSFKDYMKLYVTNEDNLYYEKINDFWEIGIAKSPTDNFTQVSMVNGISTVIGGTHVSFVSNQVVNSIKEIITKGNKGINIKPFDIKNILLLFVNCKIVNPVFDNQTKENLTSRLNGVSKDFNINDNLLRRLSKDDMFSDLIELSLLREKIDLSKELNKAVTKRVRIDKLLDANKAGTAESEKCYLMLTEGDCLHEDTYIMVIRDQEKIDVKIKDVKIDDVVITHKSKFRTINSISKKIEQSVKITLKNGNILICSNNHKWYVYNKINNNFEFIRTSELDLKNHKMIINKNVNFCNFIKINDIIKTNKKEYDYLIRLSGEDVLSTHDHKFSVLNIENSEIEMIECKYLDKNIHFIVNYNDN